MTVKISTSNDIPSLSWITPQISICSLVSFEANLDKFQQVLALIPFTSEITETLSSTSVCVKSLELEDTYNEDLFIHLDAGVQFIANAIKLHHRIAIVCVAGISRSVSFGIAFLMKKEGFSYEQAIQHIQKVRSMACPNTSFAFQLHLYAHGHTPLTSGYAYITQLRHASTVAHLPIPWTTLPIPSLTRTHHWVCRDCRQCVLDTSYVLDPHTCAWTAMYLSVILPLPVWHASVQRTPQPRALKGKVLCPHTRKHPLRPCNAKLGVFQWNAHVCRCGSPLGASAWILKKAVEMR